MKLITFVFCILFSFGAYAQSPKVFEPINNVTSQPVGGMDSLRNPKTFLVDPSGALVVTGSIGGSISPASTIKDYGSNATGIIKGSSGELLSISCYNTNASDRYILIHDKATAPVLGEVPVASFYVPTDAQTIIGNDYFSTNGLPFTNGISFCFSTTPRTCTPAAAGDKDFQAVYK